MPQNKNKDFGFNILTEQIKSEDDSDSYESGKSTRQHQITYSDDAAILQSILEYSETYSSEKYFSVWDISKNHLLDNCKYYVELYKGNKSKKDVKIKNMHTRVENSLKKLVYLELVSSKADIAHNGQPTEKYCFTKLGRLIGLLLIYGKSLTISDSEYEEIYNQIYNYYLTLNHSHAKLCLIFFTHCRISKKIRQIMYSMLELLFDASNDKNSFLNQLRFLNLVYRDMDMWNIFLDSLGTLHSHDESAYYLVLFNLKLEIEDIHQSKCRHLKQFEALRFKNKQATDIVVVGGYCNNCQNFFIVTMKTLDYLDYYIMYYVTSDDRYRIRCNSCENDYIDFQSII